MTTVSGPDVLRCAVSFGSVPVVPAAGASLSVAVLSPRECAWTASTQDTWLQISPTSGQGDTNVSLTVAANQLGNSRTGNVTVNGQRLTVSQAAAPCQFQISTASSRVDFNAGQTSVAVSTLEGCGWATANSASWARLLTASGTGSATITVQYEANSGGERRATMTIAGQQYELIQDAFGTAAPAPGPAPGPAPPPGPACSYEIDPPDRTVSAGDHDGTVKVITNTLCPWTASSNAGWITIKSGFVGVGPADVKYDVAKNPSTNDRVGTITVAGLTHTVRQRGR